MIPARLPSKVIESIGLMDINAYESWKTVYFESISGSPIFFFFFPLHEGFVAVT